MDTDAVVSGGAGFIGSHLCSVLLDRGLSVLCLDNLSTGRLANIESLQDRQGFQFLQHDVTVPLPFAPRARYVFHLASPASVPDYLSRPLQTLAVNSVGTQAMLEVAREAGAQFLFASTSEIYGDPLVHPQTETYWGNVNSVGIRACYDESKRFGEALTMEYMRTHGVDTRIVRIFNTYGPHSRPDDGRIVPNFVLQALRREPITVYGDGNQTRSFCFVSDLVAGIEAAGTLPGLRGEVINLGNPDEYTVRGFAEFVSRVLGSDAGVVYKPLPQDDPTRRKPDITRAQTVLGWRPVVSLEDGIARTAAWMEPMVRQESRS